MVASPEQSLQSGKPNMLKRIISSPGRGWVLRLAGSLIFLAILFAILPLQAIGDAFRAMSPALFLVVLVQFLGAHIAAAMKWRLLVGPDLGPFNAIRAHFAGLAANLCLPGAIGGDAARAALAQASVRDGGRVVAAAAADRLIDLVALLSLTVAGALLSLGDGGNVMLLFVVLPFFVLIFAGLAMAPWILARVEALWPAMPLLGLAKRTVGVLATYARRPATLALVFALSLAIQSLLVWLAWILALSAGADTVFAHWLFAWPLAKILAVLPVSLNGLGFRESALAALLAPFGTSAATIVAAGLVWQAIMFAAGLIGAALVVFTGGRLTAQPAKPEK